MVSTSQVSVCIPTFNGAGTIRQAVLSVLGQTHQNIEVVISDDGSTDATIESIRSIHDKRIRILEPVPRTTAAANWNRCVRESKSNLIKVMGQDDILYPECLRIELESMAASQAVLCFSRRDVISQRGRILFKDHGPRLHAGSYDILELLPRIVRSGSNPIGEPVAAMFKRTNFLQAGGFKGNYVIDVDMWIQLLDQGPAIFTAQTLSAFRVGDRSWSHQLRTSQARETVKLYNSQMIKHPHVVSRLSWTRGLCLAYIKQLLRVPAISILNFIRW